MSLRIAYLINQYPKVSHSFIRREILALERQGIEVIRIAARGWKGELADQEDIEERARTRYLLRAGVIPIATAMIATLFLNPQKFVSAMSVAIRMGIRADRPLFYHLIYFGEACLAVRWLKREKCDHVHAHFGTNSAEVAMLANALGGPPYSFTVHGPEEFDKPEFLGIAEKIKRSAFVVAISSFGRSQLFRWISHEYWSKIHVVHCGIESTFYDGPRHRLPDAPRLVCVGRLCEQKGQLLLIEACVLLTQQGIDFDVVFAGDGEMRAQVEELIKRHGLADRVSITGWISGEQVRDEIHKARGLVLPSFAEGLPVVIMEAMALRRPVLTTTIAGIPELVRHGESGFLFTPGSVEAVVEAIKEFLKLSDAEVEQMGENAYNRVTRRHSVDKEAEKLSNLFRISAEKSR